MTTPKTDLILTNLALSPATIGVSGVAGSGKDLFYSVLEKTLTRRQFDIKRVALADALKNEVREFCNAFYNVDPIECSRKEKDLIRPFLVAHGTVKRKTSEGRHWIDKLQGQISTIEEERKASGKPKLDVICVTDVRYAEHEKDEHYWVKNERKGIIVHISKYKMIDGIKIYDLPANDEEARNDPKIKKFANFLIEWEHITGSKEAVEAYVTPYVERFVDWLPLLARHPLDARFGIR